MSVSLSAIEQAIKEAVQALGRTYIAEIKTYGGEFDEDGLPNVVRRLPAVWTTFEGSGTPEQFSAHKFKLPLVFVVLVGARSIRSEEATRHGAEANGETISVGTFQLLQDVQYALMGRDFSELGIVGLSSFKPGKVRTIFNTKVRADALSVLAQEWHTSITLTTPDREGNDAEYLERININYISKPDETVASDLVELENQS